LGCALPEAGGAKPEQSRPVLAFSFGQPAASSQAAALLVTTAEQPKTTLADSTNMFEMPRFSFGSKPADPKTKKVS
jgi:hypothetical protein